MSNTKFTPGPWQIAGMIRSGDAIEIKTVNDDPYCIGMAYDVNRNPENKANAHLIAAAPELYKELERLVFVFGNKFPDEVEAAKAALLKAQGGSK